MPNDCWNHMTITCQNPEELTRLINNELKHEENNELVYHETVTVFKKGSKAINFDIWSAWNPNYEWLENLLTNYPLCWVKNEWSEEGGWAGVWVGYMDNNNEPVIKTLQWDDLCIEDKHYLFLDENENQSDSKCENPPVIKCKNI